MNGRIARGVMFPALRTQPRLRCYDDFATLCAQALWYAYMILETDVAEKCVRKRVETSFHVRMRIHTNHMHAG
jgi:hypothetical protein